MRGGEVRAGSAFASHLEAGDAAAAGDGGAAERLGRDDAPAHARGARRARVERGGADADGGSGGHGGHRDGEGRWEEGGRVGRMRRRFWRGAGAARGRGARRKRRSSRGTARFGGGKKRDAARSLVQVANGSRHGDPCPEDGARGDPARRFRPPAARGTSGRRLPLAPWAAVGRDARVGDRVRAEPARRARVARAARDLDASHARRRVRASPRCRRGCAGRAADLVRRRATSGLEVARDVPRVLRRVPPPPPPTRPLPPPRTPRSTPCSPRAASTPR